MSELQQVKHRDVVEYSKNLNRLGIENAIITHITTPKILEVLDYLHLKFSDCMPTLVMKGDGKYYAVVFRGDYKVDFKKIKKDFSLKNLRMATPEEFITITLLPIGAARVFIPQIDRTLIDIHVFEKQYLLGGSGAFDCSIKYTTDDLKKIPNSVISDITA